MKNAKVLIGLSLFTLSLFSTKIVCALAQVESRSYSAAQGENTENVSLDILRKMEFLQQEVQELRGKVEEQTYQLQQLQIQQKKLYSDLDQRLQNGTKPVTIGVENRQEEIIKPLDASQTPLEITLPTSAVSTDETLAEEKSYQNAYRLIQNKDYENALTGFTSLIKNFPHGKYLPNAHYWLGEIYLAKENLELAAQSFDFVFRQFPVHPKAADALLKLGYVAYGKGEWKHSKELLSQVKKQFPGSTSAQLADSRLQQMQQEGHI